MLNRLDRDAPFRMEARHLISAASPSQFPPESLPEIAFLGRSNVGKSSLLNSLIGQKGLAFTSSKPGCTQLINFYHIDGKWQFVDLPGYGYARVPLEVKERWKRLIDSYLLHRNSLEMALVILDSRRGWMDMDLELKAWLEAQKLEYAVVATKFDKLNLKEQQRSLKAIQKEMLKGEPLPFSALTGRGAREIWQTISKTRKTQ